MVRAVRPVRRQSPREQRRACRDRLRPTLTDLCKQRYGETVAARCRTIEQLLADDAEQDAHEHDRRRQLLSEVFEA